MTIQRVLRAVLGVAAVACIAVAPACKRKSPEEKQIADLQAKSQELDQMRQKTNVTGSEQARMLREAGVTDVQLGDNMQLTAEQRKALEERVKAEKPSSYQALLQEVLEKDKEIKELNEKITKLRNMLPKPDVAKENDSHFALAVRYLRKKGLNEETARRLASRVNLMEKLAPGFEVYHFYNNGVYGTWVTQGKAKITPNDLIREEREKVEGERDTAVATNVKLEAEVSDLAAQRDKIAADIEALRGEKAKIIEEMNALTATNEAQKSKLNSLHYVVGERKKLEKDGIIIVPVFAKDRAGANWSDGVFNQSLDLRSNDTIVIRASDVGLKQIGKVVVVPGSLERDRHYSVTISGDKQSATVKLLVKDRFRNEKVVFAVVD